MIKISIITITFNAEDVLRPTLESILAQDYPYIEYIVVDGASQDNTLTLVNRYCPKAKVLSEPDSGLYDAMNKGIALATGDYIWFLNAGDSLRNKETIGNVVKKIEEFPIIPDILYGDTMIVNKNRQDIALRRLRPPKDLVKKDFLKGMLVCHQAFIVKRSIALPYQLKYKLSSDYDWSLRLLEKSTKNLFIEEVIVNYLEGGLTNKKHWQSLKERFMIMKHHFGFFPTLLAHFSFLFCRHR